MPPTRVRLDGTGAGKLTPVKAAEANLAYRLILIAHADGTTRVARMVRVARPEPNVIHGAIIATAVERFLADGSLGEPERG